MTDRDDNLRVFYLAVLIVTFGFVVGWILRPSCGAEAEHYALNDFAVTAEYVPMPGGWLLSWDGTRRVPAWTLERLTTRSFGAATRENISFHHDSHEEKEFPSSPDDFNGFTHVYDRGHLAAADNHSDTHEHLKATFSVRNTVPQAKALNETLWLRLEEHVRSLCRGGAVVWVVTMPVWTPDDYPKSWEKREATFTEKSIGANHLRVPPFMAKSVLVQRGSDFEMHSWLIENSDPPDGAAFTDYEVPTDTLESLIGSNLWKRLSPGLQERLESGEAAK